MKPESLLKCCNLCPRRCGVDRLAGGLGFCGAGKAVKLARAALHFWEEPCLSGKRGSGTVFFSHCTLGCVYCQNHDISVERRGREVTVEQLTGIYHNLERQGAHNINLVTPTHYIPQILESLSAARREGLSLPIVYNTSGYERPETLRLLEGFVDVYLPDFKYFDARYAKRYSGAENYPEAAKEALAEMVRQTGKAEFDRDGMMTRGVIVRHLMLPGLLLDSKRAVEYLFDSYGDAVYLSLMSQYTPRPGQLGAFPELNRTLDPRYYRALLTFAQELGVENGFIQEGGAEAESFIPPFDGEGVPGGDSGAYSI